MRLVISGPPVYFCNKYGSVVIPALADGLYSYNETMHYVWNTK